MNTHKIPSGHKLSSCILVCFMAFAFLSNVLFTSCGESSKRSYTIDSLYGLWEYEDTTSGFYVRLELRQDNKAFYHYSWSIVKDTGGYCNWNDSVFHTFTLSGDSLIMTDMNNNSTILIIEEYTDSTITFKNLMDIKDKVSLSRYSKFERNNDWFMPEDSLDYVMNESASYEMFNIFREDCVKGYKLSDDDLAQVLDMMRMCADRDSVSFECYVARLFPLNWYIRQYAAYINKEGHIMVYVSLTYNDRECFHFRNDEKEEDYNLDSFLNEIYVHDGGEYYGSANIDLTCKKVMYFKAHGTA